MKSAEVVIGANFGDEGKGLITDYLSAKYKNNALVVRFNGGSQAGHTVTTKEGLRFIFGHHGSGSYIGAATFLSRFFICNPLIFFKERHKLQGQSFYPTVYVDNRSIITTPYDMMINQLVEQARGDGQHGSCGIGIGETIERHEHKQYQIFYSDLADLNSLKDKLLLIRENWVVPRLRELGINDIPDVWKSRIISDGIVQKFLDDTLFFTQTTQGVDENFLRDTDKKIIFEGAQGLLLDQDHKWFPHVTRSKTGLHNVIILAEEAGIEFLRTAYLTRAYLTRHGAGPLPNQLDKMPYPRIVDETNKPHEFQGILRFAYLDIDLLAETINEDLQKNNGSKIKIEYGLSISCLDQVDAVHSFMKDGKLHDTDETGFINALKEAIKPSFVYLSHGPRRDDVTAGTGVS